MPRKPIAQENIKPTSIKIAKERTRDHKRVLPQQPLMTPRERMWAAMLHYTNASRDGFAVMDIEDLAHPIDRTSVEAYLQALQAAGLAEKVAGQQRGDDGKVGATKWKLLVKWAVAPRVNAKGHVVTMGLGVLAMWRVARIRKRFSPSQLANEATVGEVRVTEATAKKYCAALARSGHLRVLDEAKSIPGKGKSERLYLLVKDTGPHAPAITRAKVVFDRNTGVTETIETAQELANGLD